MVACLSSALQVRGAAPPYVVLVSLIGVKDRPYSFARDGRTLYEEVAGILDRDQFHFSEMLIEDVPFDGHEYTKLIRPRLDQAANGRPRYVAVLITPAGSPSASD